MALAKDRETLDFDVPGELRFTPKVHRRVRNSSISRSVPVGGKINRCAPGSRLRSFGKRKTRASRSIPLGTGLWFTLSSGEWIRTTDLRVMSPTSYLCSTPHRLSTTRILLHSSISVKFNQCQVYTNKDFSFIMLPSLIN